MQVSVRRLPVAAVLLAWAGGVLALPTLASADAPVVTGWWSQARPTAPAVGAVPADPTYTDDGTLAVRNTPAGPAAIAALHYSEDGASAGKLSLQIASDTVVEAPQLVACPTTSSWSAGGNQAWDQAPTYDCGKKIAGQVSGSTVTWTLDERVQDGPGSFDVVILPDPSYTTPFSLTFAKPGADSFAATSTDSGVTVPSTPVGAGAVPTAGGSAAAAPGPAALPALSSGTSFGSVAGAGVPPSVAAPDTVVAPPAGAPVVAPRTRTVAADGNSDGRRLGIGLIALVAVMILWAAANPGASSARRFHHPVLASMGGGARPVDDPDAGELAAPAPTRPVHPILLQGVQGPRAAALGRRARQRTRPPVRP